MNKWCSSGVRKFTNARDRFLLSCDVCEGAESYQYTLRLYMHSLSEVDALLATGSFVNVTVECRM